MILQYTARNLWARRTSSVPIAIAIAAAVFATILTRAMLSSAFESLLIHGDDKLGVVVSRFAQSDLGSRVPRDALARVSSAAGVASPGDRQALSAERLTVTWVKSQARGLELLQVRGVDPSAFTAHRGIELVAGRRIAVGASEVMLGVRQVGRYPGYEMGGKVLVKGQPMQVVGVFNAQGSMYESELWVDRSTLATILREDELNLVFVPLAQGASSSSEFSDAITKIRDLYLDGVSSEEFRRRGVSRLRPYEAAGAIGVWVLLLGSTFACSSAIYTSLLGRQREVATLMAIGYTRRRVAVLLLMESLLLSVGGGALGIALSSVVNGWTLNYDEALICTIRITPPALLAGLLMSVAVGVLSGLVVILHSRRMSILDALRGV